MKYTIWEQTPLKWHKFVTYFLLPVSILFGLLMMYYNYIWWPGIITMLDWIDIYIYVASLALAVIAFVGNLPKVRRWYGPCCLIAGYWLNAAVALFLVFFYLYWQTPAYMVGQQVGRCIAGVILGCANIVYYEKRRALFRKQETPVPLKEAKKVTVPEKMESSVDLLANLQAEAEQERMRASEPAEMPVAADKAGKGRRLAVLAGVCVLGILCGAAIGYAISNSRVAAFQAEKNRLENDYAAIQGLYNGMKSSRDNAQENVRELKSQLSDLETRIEETAEHSNFLMDHIGFVVDGSPYYHTYECIMFQTADEYWAHNIEYCEYIGYTECPACH